MMWLTFKIIWGEGKVFFLIKQPRLNNLNI